MELDALHVMRLNTGVHDEFSICGSKEQTLLTLVHRKLNSYDIVSVCQVMEKHEVL